MSHLSSAFARMLRRLGGDAVADVGARVVEALDDGHTAIPDDTLSADEREALAASALVGDGTGPTPLVAAGGVVQLAAQFREERRVARGLLALATHEVPVDAARLAQTVRAVFPPGWEQPEQEAAVAGACRRRLAVLAGGPGTGKTTTVVRLLAARVDQALAAGRAAPRILLLAPTGKAAARLGSSVAGQAEGLSGLPSQVIEALPRTASTVHRALGASPGWRQRVRHDAARPWEVDVVVVDEASMLDLSLVAAVLDALPSGGSLVLVGDPNQLASVGAGAVLSAVVAAPALAPAVHRLVRSKRFDATGPIARAADAVLAGDPSALRAAAGPDLLLLPAHRGRIIADAAAAWAPFCAAVGAEARLAALDEVRVLCALRRGPLGAEAIAAEVEAALSLDGPLRGVRGRGRWFHGQPLLITSNAPELGLQNGDTVVILDEGDGLRGVYRDPTGALVRVLPGRLPAHERAWAMTVHKSQGSEFGEVMLVLADQPSPLLGAELLYTGLTRAKRRVRIYSGEAELETAVQTPVRRWSGLPRWLAAPGAAATGASEP